MMRRLLYLSALILYLYSLSSAADIEYVVSALWNNIRDIKAQDGRLYCAYVEGLQILDVSNPHSIKPLGHLFFKGWCNEVAVTDKYALLAGCYEGLPIIDVSKPRDPCLIAMYDSLDFVSSISAFGNLVFAGDTTGMLHIIDISDPKRPRAFCRYQIEGEVMDVALKGDYVFLTIGMEGIIGYQGGYLQVLDISDRAHPILMGNYYTEGCAGDIIIEDSLIYLAEGFYGLQILRYRGPDDIIMIGQASCRTEEYKSDIVKIGSCIYISRFHGGFCIYDLTEPSGPKLIESSDILSDFGRRMPRPIDISSEGQFAYLTGINPQITVIDVENPKQPRVISTYGSVSNITDISIQGQYAYVLDKDYGISIMALSKSGQLSCYSSCPIKGEGQTIAISKGIALVALGDSGVAVVDISNARRPAVIGSFKEEEFSLYIERAFIQGDLAYLTGRFSGALILDIADPRKPEMAARFIGTNDIKDISFSGNRAYLASEYSGLQIFDLKDPLKPTLIGSYDTQYANAVEISGNYAFIADGADGLVIADISQPDNIQAVTTYKNIGENRGRADLQFADVAIIADRAFLLTETVKGKVMVLDISNPAYPLPIAEYNPIEFADRFFVKDDLIFIPDWNNLIVLRLLR